MSPTGLHPVDFCNLTIGEPGIPFKLIFASFRFHHPY
jgi:hypothetical protein